MAENIKRETPSEVSLEARLEEVVSPFEEVPSVEKLDAPQLREFVLLIDTFGVERTVNNGCHENGGRANGTGHESVILADGGTQDGVVESGHEAGREGMTIGRGGFIPTLEDWVNIHPLNCRGL